MNKKLLFVMPLGWLLAGCVTPMMDGECMAYTMPGTCSGDPQAPSVTVNTEQMIVNPGCVNANADRMLVFRLTPRAGRMLGDTEIFPKDEEDTWLAGTNDANADFIFIPVPADLEPGDHDYGIRTEEKCVDPRVRVR